MCDKGEAIKNSKNVLNYCFGEGSIKILKSILNEKRIKSQDYVCYVIDHFFKEKQLELGIEEHDVIIYLDTSKEITTDLVDQLTTQVKHKDNPVAIVGVGGGSTLDMAKAISNLLTNGGKAEDYQGWDLVQKPGIFKIGISTLSGTGAEASSTCVMMNVKKNLKLGMNSKHTIFDQLILDPDLVKTVPRSQFFYSGLDTYIHCIESLGGNFRHPIGDAFSHQALDICEQVFLGEEDMMSVENRSKMMVASYLGGCALANSFVGVIHPFSAGLSVVLGIHHCEANCIVMNVMNDFYPKQITEFHKMLEKQQVNLPCNVTKNLNKEQFKQLYLSTIIHEKPLINALGEKFNEILNEKRVVEIFKRM